MNKQSAQIASGMNRPQLTRQEARLQRDRAWINAWVFQSKSRRRGAGSRSRRGRTDITSGGWRRRSACSTSRIGIKSRRSVSIFEALDAQRGTNHWSLPLRGCLGTDNVGRGSRMLRGLLLKGAALVAHRDAL